MKIIQTIYSLASGGAERLVVDLCNEFTNQNQEVILCTLRDMTDSTYSFYKRELSPEVKHIELDFKPGFRIKIIRAFYNLLKKEKPDVVHCHQGVVYYILPLIFIFKNIDFYYTVHNVAEKEFESSIEKRIRSFFIKRNWIKSITLSTEISASFKECFSSENYIQIENGRKKELKSELYGYVKQEINNLKDEGKTVFLHVARLSPQKNQEMLIHAFNRLINENNNICLLVIGNGFNSKEGFNLQKKAGKDIYFLGEKTNVVDYYLNADAFCLSSLYEGLPITLLEALSSGCVPICTPVGGIPDVIKDKQTGYLAESCSEDDFCRIIKYYLGHKNDIKSKDLKAYFDRYYSIEICVRKHMKLYLENLKSGKK